MVNLAVPTRLALASAGGPREWLPGVQSHVQPASRTGGSLGFGLFLLVNAVLFIRPAEIIVAVQGWPIYEVVILLCAAASLPGVLAQLNGRSLSGRPVSVCVLGLFAAIEVSHLARMNITAAREAAVPFAKVVVYYFLLLANVDTEDRLRRFLKWLAVFTTILTVLALLQYHGVINIPALAVLEEYDVDEDSGELATTQRLRSTGLYNDPNDLCLILVSGMMIAAHGACRRGLLSRLLWLVLLGVFGYALFLTRSRGGLIALLAALLVFAWARFGSKKAIIVAALAAPLAFLLFSGRQTRLDLSDKNDTAQARVQLWSEGLLLFKESPLIGIGYGEYEEQVGQVAHNSFVHCFTELGFLGGTLFVGACACALEGVRRRGRQSGPLPKSLAMGLRPCVLAIVAGYVIGMLSLSRAYVVPTYLVLGLGAAYAASSGAMPPLRVNGRLAVRLIGLSFLTLAGTYVFVRVVSHLN